jgi:hypothetical protein
MRNHFLFSDIPQMTLMPLVLIVGKLDNQWSCGSFHDYRIVQLLNGISRGLSLRKSKKRRTPTRSI